MSTTRAAPVPPPSGPPPMTPVPRQEWPRPPSALRRRWPGPASAPDATNLLVVSAAAAIGAAALPLDRAGTGWLAAGVAGAAAVAVGAKARDATAREAWARWLWCAATVALLGVGTVRDAGWLFALCVLAAAVTACLALADARSVRAMLVALALPVAAAARAIPWMRGGVRARGGRTDRALVTALVSAALLVVFGALFSSADTAFADLVERALPTVSGATLARWLILFPALLLALGGATFLRAAPADLSGLEAPARRAVRTAEWAIPVALLDALFLAFVLVQITVLFGGAAHVLAPDGPTFAEYARRGFWQLLVVTALTLVVIAAASRWAPRTTRADRVLVRVLLGALAALTLVIVASALYRMNVYEQAYGYTRLRVSVSAVELALGAVFLLVLAAGIRLRGAWLPRAVVAVGVVALLGLVVLDPDRFVADRNVDRFAQTGRIDLHYLNALSADAVPALDRLSGNNRACALWLAEKRLADHPDDWRGVNLARQHARDLLAQRPAGICTSYR